MRTKRAALALCVGLMLTAGFARAQIRSDRPGAFLIFPDVVNRSSFGSRISTFVSVTNVSDQAAGLHLAFIRGTDCIPCDLDLPLGPRGSRTIAVSRLASALGGSLTRLTDTESGASVICPGGDGFVTANAQIGEAATVYDDVLIGASTTLDYDLGASSSIPAIAVQRGATGGDGSLRFDFDGKSLAALPVRVTGPYFTPDTTLDGDPVRIDTYLTLVSPTLESDSTVCDVTIFDRDGAPEFPEPLSVELSCWARLSIEMLEDTLGSPLFADDDALLEVACRRDAPDSVGTLAGGVLGSITHTAAEGAVLRRSAGGPAFDDEAAWSRLLDRSPENGDAIRLNLGPDNCPGVPNPDQTDFDGDGIGDACDFDDDDDGVTDESDSAPLDPNLCRDFDGDSCDDCVAGLGADPSNDGPDADADGQCDPGDNCPIVFNPDQLDSDGNGVGNACELATEVPQPGGGKKPRGIVPDRTRPTT